MARLTIPSIGRRGDIRRAAELISARKEASVLAAQFESIAGGLLATDPDFFGKDVSALIDASRQLRNVAGS